MQTVNCLELLNEILQICPLPVQSLIKYLTKSLCPGKTQTRYVEIGSNKWWLKNIARCSKISALLFGNRIHSYYMLSAVSIRMSHMPIFSKASCRSNLRFLELRYHLSLLTSSTLMNQAPYLQCKHFSKDSWTEGRDNYGIRGLLVRILRKDPKT